MRANEFVLEGPLDKAGDWMQKQVIGRKQIDQRKAREQNIPKIVKLLQQNIAAKAGSILKKYDDQKKQASAINNMVIDVLNKSLAIKEKDKEKDVTEAVAVDELVAVAKAVLANPTGAATDPQVTKLLTTVVTNSFDDSETEEPAEPEEPKEPEQPAEPEEPTPGSKDRLQKFAAEVFYPEGQYDRKQDGEQRAYVNRQGKWSMFQMIERKQWEFITSVADEKEEAGIEKLIAANDLQPFPKTFKYNKQDYYWVN